MGCSMYLVSISIVFLLPATCSWDHNPNYKYEQMPAILPVDQVAAQNVPEHQGSATSGSTDNLVVPKQSQKRVRRRVDSSTSDRPGTIIQTLFRNPQTASLLMAAVGVSDVSSLLDNGGETQFQTLLSTLEEVFSEVQYFLSPEGLESEDRCTADVSAYLKGVGQGQVWALQMLDASGKPGRSILQGASTFLGNYDECLRVSHPVANRSAGSDRVIKGNYCHFVFTMPSSISNLTNGKMPFSAGQPIIQWDLCLPASCNNSAVTDAATNLVKNITGVSLITAYFTRLSDWKEDGTAVAAVFVICLVIAVSLVGTLYDIITAEAERHRQKYNDKVDGSNDSGALNNEAYVIDNDSLHEKEISHASDGLPRIRMEKIFHARQKETSGLGRQLLLSFSISRNTEKILSTRTGDGNLGCIHGIRVLSMAWVILGHSMTWDSLSTWENKLDYANWMRRFTMQFLVNGTLAVDTFFVLSGCLLTFLFLRECEKSARGKPTARQMVIYYIHRWWRLTPVYMFIILFYSGLLGHLIQGPVAESKILLERDNCRDNWWTNILYINNFYSFKEMCFPASWFLAADMQFYMIAPLALLPIAFGIRWLGYSVMCLFGAVHIGSYGYLEWKYGGATQFVGNGDSMDKIYPLPWCRVGVFAVGMVLGAILQRTKGHIRIPRYVLVLGWQVVLAVGLLCTYVTYDDFGEGQTPWDVDTRIVHETLYRPLWGVFVSWVILVCCTGHGGFVNSLLSWSAWIPLGRLTYGAYLVHPVLLSYTEFSVRSLRYADIPYVSYHFLGTFIVSYALSFFICVLVESPCLGLEKAVLGKLKK
ncbi:nose resistant to fluoxetine protein 6-like [Haliotis rubra]|uniref:nose resistant to fluoxetine protein 6-like n=1 Tax=Haliotis rubra TaxID=36100 RepID=UPI001EE54050|nr:nose resistant to fluoxetine protein 6-like [Haliotis rubra]